MIQYFQFLFSKNKLLINPSRLLILFILFQSACVSPDPIIDLSPEEKDLYVTNRDKSIDFSNYQTYTIVDSVHVVSKSSDSTDESISSAPLILSTINSELQKAGFVKVDTSQNPDAGISVSVLKYTEEVPVGYLGAPGYFGYVSPAFYGFPGYGYAYPGYSYYQIEIGSISIEMLDLKSARTGEENSLNVIWNAVLAGSLADTGSDNNERIVKAITGAFEQSPYLKDGK